MVPALQLDTGKVGHLIISHARRFIFIKTKKTAGTSLEIALSKYVGNDDVLSPLVDYDEKARHQISGRRAQNHQKAFRSANLSERIRMISSREAVPQYREHLPAVDVRKLVDPAVWDGYFKFTVVRNPFDRMISRYFWSVANGKNVPGRWSVESFNQYLRYFPEHINENWNIYTAGDEPLVDAVVRYERLEEDLAHVSERIGLPHNIYDDMKAIKAKSGIRPDAVEVDELIGPEEEALIRGLCAKEIASFGYSLDTVRQRGRTFAAAS
jgi:hypothetical protein